jgi:hypothetical protein
MPQWLQKDYGRGSMQKSIQAVEKEAFSGRVMANHSEWLLQQAQEALVQQA